MEQYQNKCLFDNCHDCCARKLRDWRADTDANGEYRTALQTAKRLRNERGAKILLDRGVVYQHDALMSVNRRSHSYFILRVVLRMRKQTLS